jgi:hypothetical protein
MTLRIFERRTIENGIGKRMGVCNRGGRWEWERINKQSKFVLT